MPVPEQLVTIRVYDSPDLAEGDRQILLEAGIPAYVSGGYHRHNPQTEIRVPISQVEDALALLPEELPTLADLTAPTVQCVLCRSTSVRTDSPAMRWVLVIGALLAGWVVLYRGAITVAIMLLLATVTLAAGVRARFHVKKCDACGHVWHRTEQLGE
ncbi:MAG: hypothetical protein HY657_12955 [Acidobacteria bacterium]|nr:hypothetical protein [Acidobacteriota bacterium]